MSTCVALDAAFIRREIDKPDGPGPPVSLTWTSREIALIPRGGFLRASWESEDGECYFFDQSAPLSSSCIVYRELVFPTSWQQLRRRSSW